MWEWGSDERKIRKIWVGGCFLDFKELLIEKDLPSLQDF